MPDREKVIKKLEECLSASCRGFRTCPYSDDDWDAVREALALLREQEPAAANWEDQTDLDDIYLSWRCSRCGHYSPTETRYAYCPYCGAKMEVGGDA